MGICCLAAQEYFGALFLGVIRIGHSVPDGTLVRKYFVIVTTHKSLVTEKVNFVIIGRVKKFQAVRLIPSRGEAVKTDLSANRVRQVQVRKFFFHFQHHGLTDLVLQIELFVVVALLTAAIATNGRNVEHATAKFEKCAALCREMNNE